MPEYLTKAETLRDDVIKSIIASARFPEKVTAGDKLERLPGGSKSVAVKSGGYVFRFPLSHEAFQSQKRERFISGLLKRYISPTFRTGITDVRLVDDGDDGSGHYTRFAYHRFIGGRIMDNNRGETAYNTSFYHLDEERKESLARRIAGFFVELHAVPADEIAEINGLMPEKRDNWNYAARIDFDYDLSRSLLLKYSKGLIDMDDFKTGFTDDVCFCHNDLSGSNILIDKDRTEVLSGIIDFGNANIAPRTDDFVPFYKVGRNLARRVIRHYNKLSDSPVSIREIDYKALSFIGYLMCFRYRRNEEPLEFSRAMTEHFANDIRAP
ncbi:MAG: aminoglycoside phosphotransferase family protein [Alphaproteobacteria bacterium]|jgi:serine/threonine protein kinase